MSLDTTTELVPLLAESPVWHESKISVPGIAYEVQEPPYDLIDSILNEVPIYQDGQTNPELALLLGIGTCVAVSSIIHTAVTKSDADIESVIIVGSAHAQNIIIQPGTDEGIVIDNGYTPSKANPGHEQYADVDGDMKYVKITPSSHIYSFESFNPRARSEFWLAESLKMIKTGNTIVDLWTRWYTGSGLTTKTEPPTEVPKNNPEDKLKVNVGHNTLLRAEAAKDFVDYFTYNVVPIEPARRRALYHALWAFNKLETKITNPDKFAS